MSKEVATKKTETKDMTLAEQQAHMMSEWGEAPISSKDIVIPRILLMNPTSDMVTEGNAAFGEFRDSLTNRKLGDFKTTFKFIPFHMTKLFVEYDMTDPKDKKFLRVVPITQDNESLPYEDEEKDEAGKTIPISRDYTLNFYGLLPDEVKRGGELPYILTFRRSSLQQGKKLATQMYVTNRGSNLPPAGLTVTIQAKKTSNDQSTWAIPEVLMDPENTEKTDHDVMMTALKWFKMVKSGQAKADDTALEREAKAEVEVKAEPVAKSGPKEF